MDNTPRPGQRVRWRDPRHARAIGWLYTYGPGPFEVVGVVGRSGPGLPAGLVLETDLGRKKVNEVWLELEGSCDGGPRRAARPLHILVVDDDRDTADSLCLLVAGWGHQPLVAYGGAGALATALAEKPDIILLDLGLPDVDGWTLARRLRGEAVLEDCVLFALTGYKEAGDREKSYAAGIDQHFVKPAEPERLQRLLAALARAS